MTASEKLTQLIENDKLTEEQLDNLNDWGITNVSDLEELLIDKLKELRSTDELEYGFGVSALYALLDYKDLDFVEYTNSMVNELDFDTLDDALDID